MKQISGKELAKAIQRNGWTLSRAKGSHHIFLKAGRPERIVIPIHGNQPLKIGLLKSLLKIADIKAEEV